MPVDRTPVEALASAQLAAYNAADIDAFCACYHPEVAVLDHAGAPTILGLEAFRARYGALFAEWAPSATVDARLSLGDHVVEREQWSRVHRTTGERSAGEVLVRYTEADGRIRWVEFLK